MIDIKVFRENSDLISESQNKRFKDPNLVDQVIALDEEWRKLLQEVNALRKERNQISRQIGPLKKKGESTKNLEEKVKKVNSDISKQEEKANKKLEERDKTRYSIGNILLPGVPIAKTEKGDVTIREWGEIPKFDFPVKSHTELVEDLNVAEVEKAAEVSGSRTFYLMNEFVFLNLALIQYALDFLVKEKNFVPFWTPPFLRREIMEGASELDDFESTLYSDSNENVFFIATSE